jgi:hypothetical protein
MLTPTLLAGVSRTLARDSAPDPEAVAALLEAFHPQTPVQAMLAAQAIALHHAAMDCFGRAMETDPEDHATATRLQRNAASLTRAFTATLRTLQRCQAGAAREKPMQRETECGGAWQDGACGKEFSPGRSGMGAGVETPPLPLSVPPPATSSHNSMQHENDADGTALPVALAQARAQGATRQSVAEPEALDPRLREDDGGRLSRPAADLAENPMQQPAPGLRPGGEEPTPPRWEDLTEAEQFALLYPERVAAGATSHEDADLWLFNPAVKQPHATWETPSASPRRPGVATQDAEQPHVS